MLEKRKVRVFERLRMSPDGLATWQKRSDLPDFESNFALRFLASDD